MFALLCVCSKPSAARIRFARTLSICNNQQEKAEEELFASIRIQIKIFTQKNTIIDTHKYKHKWTNRTLQKSKVKYASVYIYKHINVLGRAERRQREICCSSICNNWRSFFTSEGGGPRIFSEYLLDICGISSKKKCFIFFSGLPFVTIAGPASPLRVQT